MGRALEIKRVIAVRIIRHAGNIIFEISLQGGQFGLYNTENDGRSSQSKCKKSGLQSLELYACVPAGSNKIILILKHKGTVDVLQKKKIK